MSKSVKYFITVSIFVSLSFDALAQNDYDTLNYIFLGHTWYYNNKVDPRIEGIDYNTFDRVWHGGDITSASSLEYNYLQYIDSLFNISNPSNQWAFGNHDLRNFNDEWLRKITGRKTYNTHFENGITTIVLNLFIAPDDCEKLDDQFEMLENVCDTIQHSSHLIILVHPGVWGDVPGLPNPLTYGHSNQLNWIANCYDINAKFIDVVYPMLLAVKNKGITVINVLGDTGGNNKGLSMISDDGIYFIASGIDHTTEDINGPDRVLIFDHIPDTKELSWQFHDLDSLYLSFQ